MTAAQSSTAPRHVGRADTREAGEGSHYAKDCYNHRAAALCSCMPLMLGADGGAIRRSPRHRHLAWVGRTTASATRPDHGIHTDSFRVTSGRYARRAQSNQLHSRAQSLSALFPTGTPISFPLGLQRREREQVTRGSYDVVAGRPSLSASRPRVFLTRESDNSQSHVDSSVDLALA
jgi:hypothetical protein